MNQPDLFKETLSKEKRKILHVEVGAGKGKFGQKFFPECYLTDKNPKYKEYVDYICPAEKLYPGKGD